MKNTYALWILVLSVVISFFALSKALGAEPAIMKDISAAVVSSVAGVNVVRINAAVEIGTNDCFAQGAHAQISFLPQEDVQIIQATLWFSEPRPQICYFLYLPVFETVEIDIATTDINKVIFQNVLRDEVVQSVPLSDYLY